MNPDHPHNDAPDPDHTPTTTPPTEPGEVMAYRPPRPRRSVITETLAWVLILGVTIFIAAGNFVSTYSPPPITGAPHTADQVDNLQLRLITRYFTGAHDMLPNALPEESVRANYDPFLEDDASEFDRLRAIIALGEMIGSETALEELDALAARDETKPFDDPKTLTDINTLRTIYTEGTGDAIAQTQQDELIDRHGWFGELAASYNRAKTDPLRAQILADAVRTMVALVIAFAIVGLAMLAGIVLFIIAMIQLGGGRLRMSLPVELDQIPDKFISPYAGVMACFMVLFVLITFGVALLPPKAGEIVMPFAIWLTLLSALWPMVHGASFTDLRHSLGWHSGRGVLTEMGAGILGYITLLPVAGVGVLTVLILTIIGGAFGLEPQGHPAAEEITAEPSKVIPLYLLACVWAPIVEETIFRGALYRYFRGTHILAYPIAAGLVQGFLFAVIHPQGILGVPALMALGFNFAMIREWRGSLIGAITAHALNNGFVFTMLLVAVG